MKGNILLIACGKKYVDKLLDNYNLISKDYNVTIYTSHLDILNKRIKDADIRYYEYDTFRYFDKFLLSHKLTKEKKESILYIDVGRLNEVPNKFWHIDLPNTDEFHFMGNWGNLKTAADLVNHKSDYFEDGYWDNILKFLSKKIELKSIPTILERVFIFPYNYSMDTLISELENLREIFQNNSLKKTNVYSGIGNGEGLALGYAITKSKIKLTHINQSKTLNKQII